jgi:ankyrin repeat protein
LLRNGADINVTNSKNASALYYATSYKYLDVMKFLVSKGANLFSSNSYQLHMSILGRAYLDYMSVKRFNKNKDYEALNKACFDFILETGIKQIKESALCQDDELQFIDEAIKKLCGKFQDSYNGCDNNSLSKILVEKIKPIDTAKELRSNKFKAFCMGAKSHSPIFNFFQNDGNRDLTKKIFSFIYDFH